MAGNTQYDAIIIGGFGHVGLPLGIVLADAGYQVGLYDTDQGKRATIEAGKMPFMEHGAEPILMQVIGKRLHLVNDLSDAAHSKFIVITIGTPVDEYLNPKTRPILELAEQLIPYLRRDHCVILRSTVFPGTARRLHDFFKERGCEVHMAYCPERIVQGYAVQELRKLPQIISGFTETAVHCAETLFDRLGVETIRVTVREAELAKLFSNAWRYIQFAITNQFYMISVEQGADYERIHCAITHNYERAQNFPRPGFTAGPCLLKDTMQLAAFYGNHFQIGHAAMLVNEGLPNFIIQHLTHDLKVKFTDRRVGILGMAFKADIDDIRDSLSYKLAKILKFHGAVTVCSDEYYKDPTFVTKEELVATCSIIIVGVPHSSYRTLVVPEDVCLIDLWGAIPHKSRGEGENLCDRE